jgi:hypothetical protein
MEMLEKLVPQGHAVKLAQMELEANVAKLVKLVPKEKLVQRDLKANKA